jgi:hypothetical protein
MFGQIGAGNSQTKSGYKDSKRKPMPNDKSKKLFSKTADKVHGKNGMGRPMRGGIRL